MAKLPSGEMTEYRMDIDYRMTIVVNYRIDIEGNNSSNT